MPLNLRTEQSDGGHEPALGKSSTLARYKKGGFTTVELFCGIGGFRRAADKLKLKTIWANDVDPTACNVYRNLYGSDALHEGDIRSAFALIPSHDILTGGFPCQPFSAAGKKAGIRDPRGTLFETIVEIIAQKRPKYFALENVKRLLSMERGIHFATVLSAISSLDYLVEWRVLNAKDFGLAQNRERVIIVGTRLGDVHDSMPVVEQLRLATQSEIPHGVKAVLRDPAGWKSFEEHNSKFPSWGIAFHGKYLATDPRYFSAAQAPVLLREVLDSKVSHEFDYTDRTLRRLHMNEAVDRFVNGVEIISNQGGGARMGYTIFGVNGLAPTLTASTSRHYERYKIGNCYRRLTPHEYARLQGFPESHCSVAKIYDQYALYGNAVPPPMIEWVLRQLVDHRESPAIAANNVQGELLDV